MTASNNAGEYGQLKRAIAALEAQRDTLGDSVVEAAINPLLRKIIELEKSQPIPTLSFEGERKLVTVMFADISGYTALSEKMDPEAVRELMNTFFNRLVPIITKYEGTVEKFIGDEIRAIFGVPVAHENDPERALWVALEMLEEVKLLNADNNTDIGMHIGINTGQVITGEFGAKGKQQYGVLGDAVHLAAQLRDESGRDEICVGQNTYRLTQSKFDFIQLKMIQIKGKSESIHAYLLQKAKLDSMNIRPRGIQGVQTRMIGREAELTSLQDWFDNSIREKQTTLVTVFGEAGVGKSRLLYEFTNWLEARPENIWHFKGRGAEQRQGAANSLLRNMFAYRFGIVESDPIGIVQEKLETGLTQFLQDEGKLKTHILGAWLGYDYHDSPYISALRDDSEQLHNQALLYLRQFFSALANVSPVVILLEDLHWADSGSLNAFVDLCRHLPELPIFILSLSRPGLLDKQPEWGSTLSKSHYKSVDLAPLAESDARDLVIEILQRVTTIPPRLVKILVSQAEGNPYYVEELVQMLLDQGVITAEEENWQVAKERLMNLQVPTSLTAVLQARLDQLLPQQKQLLQKAAVVGRVFWDAALAELGAGAKTRLEELIKRELIIQRRQSAFADTAEFVFKHALLRDVTYGTVLKRIRRGYHRLVGAWLVKIAEANGRTDEYSAIIGNHYEEAGKAAAAAEWYSRAGKQAVRQFAQEEAEQWLNRALDLTAQEDHAARFDLLMAREGVYHLEGERKKQSADLDILNDLAGVTSDAADIPPLWAVQVLIRQARYAGAVSDYEAAVRASSEALERAEFLKENNLAAAALVRMGDALWRQGEYDAAHERYMAGKLHAESAGVQAELADNIKGLGIVAYERGEYSLSQNYYEEALKIYREIRDRRGESACLSNLGLVAADQSKFIQARQYHEASLSIAREIGRRRGESICLNNLGVVARDQGDFIGAQAYHESALEIYREIGYRRGESMCLVNLGIVTHLLGDSKKAVELFEAALELAHKVGYRLGEGLVLHDLGAIAQMEGDLDKAEGYYSQALRLHEELGHPQHIVENQAGLAWVALARGDPDMAETVLSKVLEYMTQNPTLDGTMHPYRVFLICGRVLLEAGKPKQAAVILEDAYTRLVNLAEKLPRLEQQELFWQARDYVELQHLWDGLQQANFSE